MRYSVAEDGTIGEARLDLVVRYPGSAVMERIDVSVRSPFAACFARAQGRRSTAENPGAAAKEGEADKHRRYGEAVAPFIIETLGRVGREGLDLLKRLRRAALDYGKRRPGGGKPVGLNLRRVRLRVEAAVLRETADAALLALGCRSSLAMGWGAAAQAAAAREARTDGRELANVAFGAGGLL